jgi:hypothetical protein
MIEKRFNSFYDIVSSQLQDSNVPECEIMETIADYYGRAADDLRVAKSDVSSVEVVL